MNRTTINRLKKHFARNYTAVFVFVGLMCLGSSVLFTKTHEEIHFTINPQEVTQKINRIFAHTESICDQWLRSSNDSVFVANLWKLGVPEEWQNQRLTLLLYQKDSLVLWSNHIYSHNFDPRKFVSPNQAISWDDNTLLLHEYLDHDRSAYVILNLENSRQGVNTAIFESNKIEVFAPTPNFDRHDALNIGNKFYIIADTNTQQPLIVYVISWLGIALLLIGIKHGFETRTRTSNSFRIGWILYIIFIGLGFAFVISDVFVYDGSDLNQTLFYLGNQAVSVANLICIFWLIYLFKVYLYRSRHKLALKYKQLSKGAQYFMYIVFLLSVNMMIIIFYYSIVMTVKYSDISLELFKLPLVDWGTLAIYSVAALFVASRIMINNVFRTVFTNHLGREMVTLNFLIILALMIPIWDEIINSWFIMLLCHSSFIMLSLREKSINRYSAHLIMFLIFAVYISALVSVESSVSDTKKMCLYAKELATENAPTTDDDSEFQELSYFKIRNNNLEIKENNSFNFQNVMPVLNLNVDTIVSVDGYWHHVSHPVAGESIIVSSPKITILDYAAFFAYVYFFLFLISGELMSFAGYLYELPRKRGKIVTRIRFTIIGVSLVMMVLVIVVIAINTFQTYDKNLKLNLNNHIKLLSESFVHYADNSTKQGVELVEQWFFDNRYSMNNTVSVFDPYGNLINTTIESAQYDKMNSEAYSDLHWNQLPYQMKEIVVDDVIYNAAWIPLFNHDDLAGYIAMVQLNRIDVVASDPRYAILTHIFNIMVVVLLLAIFLSMWFYKRLTVPLDKLYNGMGDISALKRIEDSDDDDEVATLIRQYNRMIDYLEESYRALAQSEREGAWSEMARQVAHEIKNPLTPMRLKIQMLQRSKQMNDADLDAKIDSTLEMLIEQVDSLSAIASEFSDFARISVTKIERVEVARLLQSVKVLFSYSDRIQCVIEPVSDDLFINVDRVQMSRVLINLFQNSVQSLYRREDGLVTLSAVRVCEWVDENGYSVGNRADHHYDGHVRDRVLISIQDNGSGIDEVSQGFIFEPNFTTKTGGSGLGLAMSRQIIQNLGGDITFESQLCVGTTFTIWLPESEPVQPLALT